jgi:hypothetical protein
VWTIAMMERMCVDCYVATATQELVCSRTTKKWRIAHLNTYDFLNNQPMEYHKNPINGSKVKVTEVIDEWDPDISAAALALMSEADISKMKDEMNRLEFIRRTRELLTEGNEYYEFRSDGTGYVTDAKGKMTLVQKAIMIRLAIPQDRAVYQHLDKGYDFKLTI